MVFNAQFKVIFVKVVVSISNIYIKKDVFSLLPPNVEIIYYYPQACQARFVLISIIGESTLSDICPFHYKNNVTH